MLKMKAGMIIIRHHDERGRAELGWLDSRHTFSFGTYHDPRHMGFRSLRVINEDRVAPGGGFGAHSHDNMEIISYVLDGTLEHKDSLGNGTTIRPGEVQRMTAGTGITHSEFNPSPTQSVHFLQIWILPDRDGLPPSYEQRFFSSSEEQGRLRLVASPEGSDGSVVLHQDARLYLSRLGAGDSVTHEIAPRRHAWLQVVSGAVTIDNHGLVAGDGAAVSGLQRLEIGADAGSEILLFDLA